MKKDIFAVCDLEASYAYNFMDYVNGRKNIMFEVQAFTNAESLLAFAGGRYIEILLISDRAMREDIKNAQIGKIFILSEGDLHPEYIDYPAVYKYQSSTSVLREVMDYYAQDAAVSSYKVLKKNVQVLGIYSPIKRSLKTSFALGLAQLLGKDRSTLYLNMEEFSGFESLMGKEFQADLSDLMYFVKQQNVNVIHKLNSIVQNLNNMDYIPPPSITKDLKNVTDEDWKKLIHEMVYNSVYEYIIIDFDDIIMPLFLACSRIYMPVREDAVSQAKIEQFEKALRLWGNDESLEKVKKLKLPFHSDFGKKEFYVEQLIWGELGDYIRNLIREDIWEL